MKHNKSVIFLKKKVQWFSFENIYFTKFYVEFENRIILEKIHAKLENAKKIRIVLSEQMQDQYKYQVSLGLYLVYVVLILILHFPIMFSNKKTKWGNSSKETVTFILVLLILKHLVFQKLTAELTKCVRKVENTEKTDNKATCIFGTIDDEVKN